VNWPLGDFLCQSENRCFFKIPQIHRSGKVIRGIHEADQTLYPVIYIAERTGLGTVSINCNGLSRQCLVVVTFFEIVGHRNSRRLSNGPEGVKSGQILPGHCIKTKLISVSPQRDGYSLR